MAAIGTATVKVATDTTEVERTLRILAKHFTACADELASPSRRPGRYAGWRDGKAVDPDSGE